MQDLGETLKDTLKVDPEGWVDPATRERWMQRFSTAKDQVQTFVNNNPLAAVGVAAATGFLVARLFRR
jgi:ElaB/YqjD/DUF883 family membrane-anchored ribosome-binding protein